jgi:signal transduction histidine kinase/ligand-binding sensor domain-containing protein
LYKDISKLKPAINTSTFLNLIFILIIQCFQNNFCSAQAVDPTDLLFRYLTIENGLPNNKVNAISMDKYGFMWFGTNDGICRYDGINLKYYAQDNLSGNQARTSQVSVIKSDSRGNLLIGTYSLFRYNFLKDRIDPCDTLKGPDMTGRVFAIEEGSDGIFWIGCEKGLFSYNCLTDSLAPFSLREGREYPIISLFYDDGKLWFGTRNDGLFVFDISGRKCYSVPQFRLSKEVKDQVNCFYKDNKNIIWAGTQDDGIFKFNPADSSLLHVFPDTANNLSYRIRKIINDRNGNIWVGCRLGIFFQKAKTDSMILVKQVDPLPSTTRSNSIFDLFIDPNEVLWAGTFSFGVSYTDFKRKPFRLYNLSDEETMFFAKMINCFTDCDDRNIWIGTEEGGLFLFNRYTRKFKEYKPEPGSRNSLGGVDVKTLAREKDGNLWIGYYNSGLDYFDLKSDRISHYTVAKDSRNSVSSNLIRTLILDDDENLWIGTDKGVDFLNSGSRTFKHHSLNIEVLTLFKDKKNNIWAGTAGNGIYRFNRDSLRFDKVYSQYFSTTIKAIYIDTKDNLWVGTNKGLYYVDSLTDSLIYTGISRGLPSNAILDILEDNSQNLWVSTGAGLVKCKGAVIDPHSFRILKFGSQDGLQGEQFREFASYKNKSGEFYFGGVQGFNIFTPDSIKSNPYPPRLAFTQLKIFNRDVEIGKKIKEKRVLENALNETKLLTLSYKHSPFSIEFAALHFSDSKNNQFRYKLLPLEQDWNYSTGIRNFASYSNLRGGEYTFILEGANGDGLWNPEPRSLQIKVIPPFWQTWWFSGLLIFILSASAIGYYFYRISLLQRYNAELEKKVDDRTFKLKESLDQVLEKQIYIEEQSKILNQQKDQLQKLNSTKDKFFSIIAHDLRSPFQSLMGLSDIMVEEFNGSSKPEQKNYARLIQDSSHHIYTLVENLLTWSRTQRDKMSFEPVEIDVSSIIDDAMNLLQPNFDQKNISSDKNFGTDKHGFADKNMIEMVIRNLITNAIKFTPKDGKIYVSLKENNRDLRVDIRDNGVGITPENQQKLFKIDSNFSNKGTNGEEGTGLGLIICKEFIEKNNGRIWVESKPGEGSSFFFTIPLK